MSEPTPQDRMYLGYEAVYARIERGQGSEPIDVEAELMQAHLDASDEQGGDD